MSFSRTGKSKDNFTGVKVSEADEAAGWAKFFNFLTPIWFLIIIGLVVGITLAASGELWAERVQAKDGWQGFLFFSMKDLGIGFVVAAISVFGYEYSHKVRGEFNRQRELEGMVFSLDAAVKKLNTADEARDAIQTLLDNLDKFDSRKIEVKERAVLNLMFPKKTAVQEDINKVLDSIIHQTWNMSKINTLYSQAYLEFITWLCQDIVEKNATSLFMLEKDASPASFIIPTNKAIAGQLLGFQLDCLVRGDSYQAISNILFWHGQDFKLLWEKTKTACNNGVKIKRLFHVNSLFESGDISNETFQAAKKVIAKHKEFEMACEHYEVRFLMKKHEESAARLHAEILNIPSESIGIFTHHKESGELERVGFEVGDKQLSTITYNPMEAEVARYSRIFKIMWDASEAVENPFDNELEEFKRIAVGEI